MSFAAVGRLLRTIRHLRPRQIGWQVVHRLRRNRFGPRRAPVPERMPEIRWADEVILPPPPAAGAHDRATLLAGSVTFQNRTEAMGFPPDWGVTGLPLLWRYHLHYHDFLWCLGFADARMAALHWIEHHGPGRGQVGWEPYPTSLRLANWCALFLGRHREQTLADPVLAANLWSSVRAQANHLQRRLEWHLLGNHLFENGVALALAGSCFAHLDAESWLRTGIRVLDRELPEQVLADGGHFERSPMYQQRILHGLRLLASTMNGDLGNLVRPYVDRAESALAALRHPDGGIALMNDSAFEDASLAENPVRYDAAEPPAGPFALADSGYYGERTSEGHYVVCDAGPIGPDYQPGHAHADLLSFELSLRSARVVVDSGVSTYEAGAMRAYCRSTRAHNTVEIEGQNQVEVWSAFRVGRRCAPRDVDWQDLPDGFRLSARHDGYRHLPGRPTHARTFRWHSGGQLDIADSVDSTRPVRSVARVHLHPDCRIERLGGNACAIGTPEGMVGISWSGWAEVGEDESVYCPHFGVEVPNPCLRFSSAVARLRAAVRIAVQ